MSRNAMFSSFATNNAPGSSASWNLQTMLKTSGISMDVQQHLARVYATLAACVLVAALAVFAALTITNGHAADSASWTGMLCFVGATGGSIWLQMEPAYNHSKRFGILMGIAACMGVSLASLVELALAVDPAILVSAFLITTLVFLCFSGSALLATRRSMLFLGALLSSALSTLALLSILNLFFRSTLLYSANLYGGLAMFCAYVMFDTQMIIEKASSGDKDALRHALELFLDFVSIFVRILVVLLQNANKKNRNESTSHKSRR